MWDAEGATSRSSSPGELTPGASSESTSTKRSSRSPARRHARPAPTTSITAVRTSGTPISGRAYDVVHARFVLSHLADPQAAVDGLVRVLRPGGALIVVDIEKSATLCEPPHRSFERYIELYTLAARARGVDPDIGPQLPAILADAGCRPVRVNVVQPVGRQPKGYEGDVKLTAPVTLESIAEAILALNVAERSELDSLVDDLYRLAADDETVISTPRMMQAWGYRPVEAHS